MSKVMPIKPNEVQSKKDELLPDAVIRSFNELIAENFDGTKSTVSQNEAIKRILSKMPEEITEREIFDKKWLDVEVFYREAGWKVEYDKPGYNESYSAYFVFSKK